jgi:hypothetical protein
MYGSAGLLPCRSHSAAAVGAELHLLEEGPGDALRHRRLFDQSPILFHKHLAAGAHSVRRLCDGLVARIAPSPISVR